MNLPDQPPTFRAPSPSEQPWTWRLENDAGEEVSVDEEYAAQRFPTQADAESWVGESWRGLLAEGVEQVTLLRDGDVVYGPMSLRPLE